MNRIIAFILCLMLLCGSCAGLAETWACPYCGATNDGQYCQSCGAALEEAAEQDNADVLATGDGEVLPSGVSRGDIVSFGRYEQDVDPSNDSEAIEWIVLESDGNTVTLISRYGLDATTYNAEYTAVTWENSTLRQWLNDGFLNAAFTANEQDALVTVTVTADKNPETDTDPGNDTQDKVYLLSVDEANRCFASNGERICRPTGTAIESGVVYSDAKNGDTGACRWWLRTPGDDRCAAYVDSNGSIVTSGDYIDMDDKAVRPVVVVQLEYLDAEWASTMAIDDALGEESGEAVRSGAQLQLQDGKMDGEIAASPDEPDALPADDGKRTEQLDIDVGDVVAFGHFDQDENLDNGAEPIAWVVLEVDGDAVTLISRYPLCRRSFYEEEYTEVTWEVSSLRTWLNDDFYNAAFSDEESTQIVVTTVPAARNPQYETYAGENVRDKVRILGIDEAEKYFASDADRICEIRDDAELDYEERSWWLRSPGEWGDYAARISGDGEIDYSGVSTVEPLSVRPVITMRLNGAGLDENAPEGEDEGAEALWQMQPSAGDIVRLGRYEQDNDLGNGEEPIEWVVLNVDARSATLISRFGLDRMPFDENGESTTWEISSLRTWLNDDFYNTAFSADEQAHIAVTRVHSGNIPLHYDEEDGLDFDFVTEDRVFLLSEEDARLYYPTEIDRVRQATPYAVSQGVGEMNTHACSWWLCSPGNEYSNTAGCISYYGEIREFFSNDSSEAVVPMITVLLDEAQAAPEPEQAAHDVEIKDDKGIVGSVITFGHYEQDNDLTNGAEPIEWIVLENDGDVATLISRYALGGIPEDDYFSWLNTTFVKEAFSVKDRARMTYVNIVTEDNPVYGTASYGGVKHNVYMLSIDEAERYFATDDQRVCQATEYAKERVYTGNADSCRWWLRTSGYADSSYAYVDGCGHISSFGEFIPREDYAFRPVISLWLDGMPPERDVIAFGHYEQDNDLSNGSEPIEWIVLDNNGEIATLISRFALDAGPYDRDLKDADWENCDMRTWLNEDFLNSAFSAEEQRLLETALVSATRNPKYVGTQNDVDPGNNTKDRVYLLSIEEVDRYFDPDINRGCRATEWAMAKGAEVSRYYDNVGFCNCWLRGFGKGNAAYVPYVRDNGSIVYDGTDAREKGICIRPVIQLNARDADIAALRVKRAVPTEEDAKAQPVIAPDSSIPTGQIVAYGRYEQDNDNDNGAEPIEWLVLENDGRTATLISRYGLDWANVDEEKGAAWENCALRAWLNEDFLNAAFNEDEQRRLETVTVTADANPRYETSPGNDVQDRVYLLSIEEINRYWPTQAQRICYPTDYALERGVKESSYQGYLGTCWWWLRSPGDAQNTVAMILYDGDVFYAGARIRNDNKHAIRPVIRLRLE